MHIIFNIKTEAQVKSKTHSHNFRHLHCLISNTHSPIKLSPQNGTNMHEKCLFPSLDSPYGHFRDLAQLKLPAQGNRRQLPP